MRLLVVTQYFYPEDFRINDIVERLAKRGHDVTVLTAFPNYPAGRFFDGYGWRGPFSEVVYGAKVLRAPLLRRGAGGVLRLLLNYLSFAMSASLFGLLRCKGTYDAIFVFAPSPITVGIPARFISWLRGSPVVLWVQDLWPETLSSTGVVRSALVLRQVERLVRWIYRGCDRVLVQSEAFTDNIVRQGVPRENISYLPNSAEEFYRPLPKTERWAGPELPQGFRITFAGNIGGAQSFETILAAAKELIGHDDIHWLILGEGREFNWVRSEIGRLGLSGCVHLYGRYPVTMMPEWFAQSDAMLVTLRRDSVFEMTVPSKVQSYMACGKPILAALQGEGAKVLELSGAGIAVPSGDANALANAVLAIYGMSEQERTKLGENGLRYFEANFSQDMQIARIEKWLLELSRSAGR